MNALKSLFGLIRAVLPIVYCSSLLYYFLGFGGSVDDLKAIGLWPTVLGLGIVGLLFCIPLALRIVRLTAGLRPPTRPDDPGESFDADAIVARYKARQPSDPAPAMPPPTRRAPADPRPTFGRRTR